MLESGSFRAPLWKTKNKKKPQEIKKKIRFQANTKEKRSVKAALGSRGSAQDVPAFRPPDLLGPSASGLLLVEE